MSDEQKPSDSADKAADGAFLAWVASHPTATLASKEEARLLAEIDRLRVRCRQIDDEAYDYAEQIEQLKAEIDRQRRILAALREPSENVSKAVWSTWGLWDSQNHFAATLHALVRAAVAAAEQEVGRE